MKPGFLSLRTTLDGRSIFREQTDCCKSSEPGKTSLLLRLPLKPIYARTVFILLVITSLNTLFSTLQVWRFRTFSEKTAI